MEVKKTKHPSGLYTLFATEFWERFSYYGMRALLVLYLTAELANGGFGMTENEALVIYGVFTGLVYLTPILGGILADKFLGQRKAIFIGGIVMALGQLALAASVSYDMNSDLSLREFTMYVGLGLLILGNGFFKPNISTIVGGLYEPDDPRKDSAFTIFYMGINLGAFLAPFIAGGLGEKVAWHYGYLAAGIGMILGTIWFYARRASLINVGLPPSRGKEEINLIFKDWIHIIVYSIASVVLVVGFVKLIDVLEESVMNTLMWILGIAGGIYLLISIIKGTKGKTEWSRVIVILVLALFNVVFWSGFEQAGGTFNIFARDQTDRNIALSTINVFFYIIIGLSFTYTIYKFLKRKSDSKWWLIGAISLLVLFLITKIFVFTNDPYEIPASWFQSINAIFIVMFAPLFSMLWITLAQKNVNPRTPYKFSFGLLLLGLGFVLMAFAKDKADAGVMVTPLWLVGVYLLHTWGELCLSPIGLSMITKLSPAKIVSAMMGLWMGSIALGNYLAATMKIILEKFDFELYPFIAAEAIGASLLLLILGPLLSKMMKGIH